MVIKFLEAVEGGSPVVTSRRNAEASPPPLRRIMSKLFD